MTQSRPTLDAQATKILERLHGYMHRQEWTARDHAFILSLLQEWDTQVDTLLRERAILTRQVTELNELNRRNEWRLAGTGFGAYLKFLLGINECPSR